MLVIFFNSSLCVHGNKQERNKYHFYESLPSSSGTRPPKTLPITLVKLTPQLEQNLFQTRD